MNQKICLLREKLHRLLIDTDSFLKLLNMSYSVCVSVCLFSGKGEGGRSIMPVFVLFLRIQMGDGIMESGGGGAVEILEWL